jgi:hypothetical protein
MAKKKKGNVDPNRPTDFFVEYYDAVKYQAELDRLGDDTELFDPGATYSSEDAANLPAAMSKATRIARKHGTTVSIYRRVNIYCEPSEWPQTDWWAWESIDRIANVEPDGTYTKLSS